MLPLRHYLSIDLRYQVKTPVTDKGQKMQTAIKITRPAITKLLVEAGFTKAEWRNRSSEKLWNDGFLVSVYDWAYSGTRTKRIEINHQLVWARESDKPAIDAVTAKMFEVIQNAGYEAQLIVSDYYYNTIRISY
jgi:hypothetical protein